MSEPNPTQVKIDIPFEVDVITCQGCDYEYIIFQVIRGFEEDNIYHPFLNWYQQSIMNHCPNCGRKQNNERT